MEGFIPLILIFGLMYVLMIRPAQKMKAKPPQAMIKSPWRTDEYRDAIVSVLSPGEVLVSFADCLYLETSRTYHQNLKVKCHWGFIALTNINIRQGTWAWDPPAPSFRGTVDHPTTEIGSSKAYAIDDIVTASHSKGGESHSTGGDKSKIDLGRLVLAVDQTVTATIGNQLSPRRTGLGGARGFLFFGVSGAELATWLKGIFPKPASRVGTLFLTLTLTNGDLVEVASPFVEFEALVTNIDAAKSGALVVKNTTAAADALDQLVPLLNDGILTQEEFDRAKDGFLGATVEVRESSVGLLRQLHSLHKSGVLTESEFNLKKWDILSKDG
jgi:hypothetical protein